MDTNFLLISKGIEALLRPETLLFLLFATALCFIWLKRNRVGKRLLLLALLVYLMVGVLPVGQFMLSALERTYPAKPPIASVSGILVLGGAEDIGPAYAGEPPQTNEAAERLIEAIALADLWPNAVVLYTGGKVTITPSPSGAFVVGPAILRRLGLPEARLVVESQSRTTAENAALSLQIKPKDRTGPWLLVKSAFHMPRAVATFCAAGWTNILPYPVDYRATEFSVSDIRWSFARNLDALNIGVKEWVGWFGYRATGRIQKNPAQDCLASG